MVENNSELQYLNVLRKIIIHNAKEEYCDIVNSYIKGDLSVIDAYNRLLLLGDNNLHNVLREATGDRTGTGTYKIFGEQMKFNMADGFPLITTKKMFTKGIFEELFWFIRGETNIRTLVLKNINIWNSDALRFYLRSNEPQNMIAMHSDEWNQKMNWFIEKIKNDEEFAKKWGDLGPIYGAQWRNYGGHDKFKMAVEKACNDSKLFNYIFSILNKKYNLKWSGAKGVDQFKNVIEKLKNNPQDRRMLVYAYNPLEVDQQVLPPCHTGFQLDVKDGKLSMTMYIRSNDMFLGAPFNIASYAALLHMFAKVTKLEPSILTYHIGNCHIYANHVDSVQEQLSRTPMEMPTIEIDPSIENIEDYNIGNVKVIKYKSHPKIEGEISA